MVAAQLARPVFKSEVCSKALLELQEAVGNALKATTADAITADPNSNVMSNVTDWKGTRVMGYGLAYKNMQHSF